MRVFEEMNKVREILRMSSLHCTDYPSWPIGDVKRLERRVLSAAISPLATLIRQRLSAFLVLRFDMSEVMSRLSLIDTLIRCVSAVPGGGCLCAGEVC